MYKNLFVTCFILVGFFLGGHTAEAKVFLPNAAGFYSDASWSGTYTDVSEYVAHDSDTTVNSATAVSATRSYNLENSLDSGTITSVRVIAVAKSATQTEALRLFVRTNSADSFAVAQNLTTSYATYTSNWATNPGGGSWTTSDISSLEAGFQVTDDTGTPGFGGTHSVTQLYIEVTFKTETNKVKFHILQDASAGLASGAQSNTQFSFTITDPLDDIKSAFIEIKGVAQQNASATTLHAALDTTNIDPTTSSRLKSYSINSNGRPASFKILYDTTDYFKSTVRASGGHTFWLNLKNAGSATINISSGKLIMTYTWIVPPAVAGAYVVSGTLASSTFDTGAVNGASFHSIGWVGVLNSGRVRFQIATSNCSNGATNPLGGCTAGTWGSTGSDFYGESGGSCTTTDWYEPTVNTTFPLVNVTPIKACHAQINNKKYFRYLIQLCSLNCSSASAFTPEVKDVILNWSP